MRTRQIWSAVISLTALLLVAPSVASAQSAIAAAGTYDPDELAKLRVVGFQPDVAAARKWYERARELGAADAAQRLRRLGSN